MIHVYFVWSRKLFKNALLFLNDTSQYLAFTSKSIPAEGAEVPLHWRDEEEQIYHALLSKHLEEITWNLSVSNLAITKLLAV